MGVWSSVGFQLFIGKQVFWQTVRRLYGKRSNSYSSFLQTIWNPIMTERIFLRSFEPNDDTTHKPICFAKRKSSQQVRSQRR